MATMERTVIRRGLGLVLVGALAVACGSGDDDGSDATTPGGGSDGSGTIDANGELLLDDLDDADALFRAGDVSGEWFTYSDGTSPITPPDHTGLVAVDGAAHVSGSGFSDWGAGLSAYFRSVDLTAYDGFRLRARGSGGIVIELATPATSPPNEGGTCMGGGCFGHFAMSIALGAEYADYDITFADLVQPSWAQPAALALDGVISLNLVTKATATTPGSLDLWIDRLALHAAP
ncbi:MAG TPA: hypothetical protein VMG12_02150 [Polyangiaceae bacterium]|nr:hypothetical protein [Polyangiaceae bacterium]